MDDIAEYFIKELVVGFGFFNRVWIALGINPETEILKALDTIIRTLDPNSGLGLLLFMIPLLILIISIAVTYHIGGKLGLVAVGCSFIGGLLVLASQLMSGILLLCGIGLGLLAVAVERSMRDEEMLRYSYF